LTRISGQPHSEELRTRIYEPLRLVDTYVEKLDSLDPSHLSHGYRDASPVGETFEDWFASPLTAPGC